MTKVSLFDCVRSVISGSIGVEELEDMIEKDHGAEATCQFCGEVYQANSDHLYQLITDLQENCGG
jgi:redox-regulated HSP33 family molecular chaperone